jgi:hypothetical protein
MIQINLIPAAAQIRAAIGASVGLRLNAVNGDGTPFDLTPYTVTAPFTPQGDPPPAVTGWAVVIEGSSVLLNVTGDDTQALAPTGHPVTWHWDVWLDNNATPERMLFAHGDLGLLTP